MKWQLSLYCVAHVEDDTRLYTNSFIFCLSCVCVKSDWKIGWCVDDGFMDKWLTENYLCCGACEVYFPLHKNAWPAYTWSSHVNYIRTTAATVGRCKVRISDVLQNVSSKENQNLSVKKFASSMSL